MVNKQLDQQHWLSQASQQLLNKDEPEGKAKIGVSANYAAILTQFLHQKSIASEQLLKQANIEAATLEDPSAQISAKQYTDLLTAALQLSDDPALGLAYGQRLNISTHGLLGYAIMSSPNFDKAAALAMKYIQIRNLLVSIEFLPVVNKLTGATESAICFEVQLQEPALYRFEIDTALSSLFGIWLALLGNSEGISAIHFSYPKPDDLKPYDHVFDVPVLFEQKLNCMCLSPSAFEHIARMTDPTLTRIAEQQCEEILKKQNNNEQEANQEFEIRQLLLKFPGQFLTQQQVADELKITSRTLTRRLAKENTTFKKILDDVRKKLAIQCLQNTHWSIEEVADILNYSDAANFSRAFKRWTGYTPNLFRKKNKQH